MTKEEFLSNLFLWGWTPDELISDTYNKPTIGKIFIYFNEIQKSVYISVHSLHKNLPNFNAHSFEGASEILNQLLWRN